MKSRTLHPLLLAALLTYVGCAFSHDGVDEDAADRPEAAPVTAPAALSPEVIALDPVAQRALARYWTAERKTAALRADANAAPIDSGAVLTAGSAAQKWTGGGGIARTTGRAFFKNSKNQLEACSATVIATEAMNVVVTAAHCVRDSGPAGAFYTNWIFEPGYDDGPGPDGTWSASYYTVLPGWVSTSSVSADVAFVELHKNPSSALVQSVVGGQGITWNQSPFIDVAVFGYPAAPPFDGKSLMDCTGTTTSMTVGYETLECNMTAGSSGGPWLSGFNGSYGSVVSVTSTGGLYGAYFGSQVGTAYNAVRYNTNY